MSSNLNAALKYATEYGWRVFPVHSVNDGRCSCGKPNCPSPGKHPRTRNGVKAATTDPERITGWWKKHTDANVGIATGAESGIIVLDVDRHEGGANGLSALRRLQEVYGRLPAGPYAETGGGGFHLYLHYPGRTRKHPLLDGKRVDGIDIQGDLAFVIAPAPGSSHVSGKQYKWKVGPDQAVLPDLPTEWHASVLYGEDVSSWNSNPAQNPPLSLDGEDVTQETHTQDAQETHMHETQKTHDVHSTPRKQVFSESTPLPEPVHGQILRAIHDTVPRARGQRNHRMFTFARRLRFNLGLHDADPGDLLPYVKEWFRRARPSIDPAVTIEMTLGHFLDAWERAEHPDGGFIGRCISMVEAGDVPSCPNVERWANRALVQLDQLCRVLEREKTKEHWFLAAHNQEVQEFLGLDSDDQNSAAKILSRYLKRLTTLKRIEIIEMGSRAKGHATTYRYIGDGG